MIPPTIPGGSGGTMPPWYNRSTSAGGAGTSRPKPGSTPISSGGTLPPGTTGAPPTGIPINGSVGTETVPNSPPPPDIGTESTPGVAPPPGYATNSGPPGTSTPTRLPPAPPWSTPANGTVPPTEQPLPVEGMTQTSPIPISPSETQTRPPPVPSGYGQKDTFADKKRVLYRQKIEDDRVGISTVPAMYEEEELIYDDSDYDSTVNPTTQSPASHEAILVTGIRKWRRPSPTAGSVDRAITYRAHRRSSTARALVKRSASPGLEIDQETDSENRPSTRRYQEVEKKLHRPISNKKRPKQQHRRLEQEQRKFSDSKMDAEKESEDTFMYKDSELSNRLIIFDVDEEPPPDYMHWTKNNKQPSPSKPRKNFGENTSLKYFLKNSKNCQIQKFVKKIIKY